MEIFLEPKQDDLPMRPSGSWVAEKLYYLERYIAVFETSMRQKPWRGRNYIDLFAGPGKCLVKGTNDVYLGSPLLALTTPHPFSRYYFVDSNQQSIDTLSQRCEVHSNFSNISFYCGDANTIVREIVSDIQAQDRAYIEGKWPTLNLAFLDPEGLELKWDTVASLATVNRMDLIIHYSQMGLQRNISLAASNETDNIVDQFFGGRQWRQIHEKHQRREIQFLHRELINHYKEKLQELGYADVILDEETGIEPLIRNARSNAPLYRLLFASKHKLGHDFWREVTKRDVYGQGRLPL